MITFLKPSFVNWYPQNVAFEKVQNHKIQSIMLKPIMTVINSFHYDRLNNKCCFVTF